MPSAVRDELVSPLHLPQKIILVTSFNEAIGPCTLSSDFHEAICLHESLFGIQEKRKHICTFHRAWILMHRSLHRDCKREQGDSFYCLIQFYNLAPCWIITVSYGNEPPLCWQSWVGVVREAARRAWKSNLGLLDGRSCFLIRNSCSRWACETLGFVFYFWFCFYAVVLVCA